MQSEKRQGADLGPQGPLFIPEGGTIGNTLSLLIPLRAGATSQAAILCLATRVFELLLPLPLVAMEAASANLACRQSRLLCQRLSRSTFPCQLRAAHTQRAQGRDGEGSCHARNTAQRMVLGQPQQHFPESPSSQVLFDLFVLLQEVFS